MERALFEPGLDLDEQDEEGQHGLPNTNSEPSGGNHAVDLDQDSPEIACET